MAPDSKHRFKDTEEAAAFLNVARRTLEAWRLRGFVRRELGELRVALRDLEHAIRLAPDVAEGYAWRGDVRQALGDVAGGLADHDRAVELDTRRSTASTVAARRR